MVKPKEKPVVNLIGTDGNAFGILGRVQIALRKAGADEEYIQKYQDEATCGSYGNLLVVTMGYVQVE